MEGDQDAKLLWSLKYTVGNIGDFLYSTKYRNVAFHMTTIQPLFWFDVYRQSGVDN